MLLVVFTNAPQALDEDVVSPAPLSSMLIAMPFLTSRNAAPLNCEPWSFGGRHASRQDPPTEPVERHYSKTSGSNLTFESWKGFPPTAMARVAIAEALEERASTGWSRSATNRIRSDKEPWDNVGTLSHPRAYVWQLPRLLE